MKLSDNSLTKRTITGSVVALSDNGTPESSATLASKSISTGSGTLSNSGTVLSSSATPSSRAVPVSSATLSKRTLTGGVNVLASNSMKESSVALTEKTITASSNSLLGRTISEGSGTLTEQGGASANKTAKKDIPNGNNGWSGDNLHSNALGYDSMDGVAFGVGELGGVDHFKNITKPSVTH